LADWFYKNCGYKKKKAIFSFYDGFYEDVSSVCEWPFYASSSSFRLAL